MGYYSEVKICTTQKGFERFKELVPDEGKVLLKTVFDGYPMGCMIGYEDSIVF